MTPHLDATDPRRDVVVNATALDRAPDGLSVVARHLLGAIARVESPVRLHVVLTHAAESDAAALSASPRVRVYRVSDALARHRGTWGHLRRWIAANQLAWRQRRFVVFGLSQLEGTLVGRRGVLLIHDVIPLRLPAHHPRQRYYFAHVLGHAARRASAVAVPSESTRQAVVDEFHVPPDRVHVIPHGLTVPLAESVREPRDRLVLFLGRPQASKNLAVVMDAMRRLEPATGVRLIVAGAGATDLDRPPDLAASIELAGEVTESAKLALLDRAAVLVCPSPHEGFGLTALEGLARGCPVLAAHGGGLADACGDAALYVDTTRPDALAAAIVRVIGDEGLRRSMAARGLRRARDFSWTRAAASYVTLLERACEAPGHG